MIEGETMEWKKPKIKSIPCSMEVTMYLSAELDEVLNTQNTEEELEVEEIEE